LLVFPLLQPKNDPSKEGDLLLEKLEESAQSAERNLDLGLSVEVSTSSSEEYAQLQQRIFRTVVIVSLFAVTVTALSFEPHVSISLLVGAFSGVVYLRILARSIGKLGKSSKSVSKFQLVIPVLLVLSASKLSQLDLLPALLGFVLYKPALIFQFLLESRLKA